MKPQHSSRRDAAPSPPGSYGVAPPHFPPNGFKFPLHGLRHPALYPRGLFPPGMFHPDSRFSIPPLLALSTVHHGGRLPGRLGGYMHPFQHTPRGYHPQDQKSPNRNLDHGLSYSSGSGNRIPGSGLPLPSHAEKRKYKNRPPNRSPVCGQSRNRSPVGRQSKNRSPISGQVRSRSPFYGQSRNRSPVCGQSRSRSPVCGELRSRSPVSTFSSAQPARSVSEIQVAPQVTSCNMRGTDDNTDELRRHINNSREEMRRRAGSSSEEVWDGRNCAAREEVGRRKNNSTEEAWDRRNSSSSREEVRRHMSDGTGEVWDRRHSSSREEVGRRSSDGSEEVWDRRSSVGREEPARQTNDSTDEVWDRRNSSGREEVRRHTSDSTEDERWDRRNSSGSREDARRHRGSCNEDIWDQRCCGREPVKVVADNHTEEMVRHVDVCSEEERRCTNSHTEEVWSQRNHNTEEVRMRTDSHTDEVRMYIESQTEEVRRYADSQTEEVRNQANVSTEEEINVTNIEPNEAAEHCGNYNRMSSSGRSSPSDDIQNVTRSSLTMSGNNNTATNVGSSSSISGESLSTASSQEVFRTQRIDSADHLESQTEPLSLVKSASSSSVDDLIPSTSTPEPNLAPNRPFRNVIKISGLGSIGSKIPGAGFSQILPLKKRICTAFAMEQDTTILPFRSPLGLNKPLCVMTESVTASEDSGSVIDLSTNLSRYVLETPLQDLSKKHNCKSASKGSSVRVTSKKRKSRNRRDHSVPGITKCPVDKSKPGKARRKPLSQKSVGNSQRRTRSQTRQHTVVDDQQTVVPDVSECSSSIKTTEVCTTKQSDSDGGTSKEKTNSPANGKVTLKGAKDNEKDVSADEKCSPSKSSSPLAKASAKKAITTCNKVTKSLDRKAKPLTKGSKRASTSKCDSATQNEQMSSPKKSVNKSNLTKKLKCSSKLQGKGMSHCRNSKNSEEYKSLRRKRQPKTVNKIRVASCNNDNRTQGLDGNHGSMYIVKNTSVHVNHISCSDVAKSLVHDVSDALKIPDQPRSESTSLEKCLDVASDQVPSDDKMKGMNVVGTLSPIIKSLLGQPARGIRDLSDPVLMPQLSLKIPDVFMSKVTEMPDRSGMPMLPYAIKEDVEDREDANSRDSKLVSPKSICLKVGENDLETLSIKDLSVKICRLSPKALSEKKTARASVVEKQACPISSQVSLHKGNDVVKKEDQQQSSGLLEDLLWQVQKGYFLRRGEEKSGVSIDEAASVAQAVSYDANSADGEHSLADPQRCTVVHQSESQPRDQDKSKEHSHSDKDPVEKVGNSHVMDDRQRINTVYEVMANKQNYDSDEDNLELSDRPLVIDLPPESELNDKTSLLEDSKHPSADSTDLIKPETKSINKTSKCSQKKSRKAHRKSGRKAKQKLDPSEDRSTGEIPDFQSSDLSHELEKDAVDNGKDSGIESAGVPEQLKECPCDLSEAGERLKENNADSNNDSQKAMTVHCALVKSAGSTPKTTSKTKPRFRGIDDICASLVNKKVAKKQMPVTPSSPPPGGHETRGKNKEKMTKSASGKVLNLRQHSSPKVTNNDSLDACDSVDVCDQVRVKTEFAEKPVPCSPNEEQRNSNSAEETVEVLEKSVTSAESEAESLINNASTQPEVESSETSVICAESELEKSRDSSKTDGETLTKCSNSIKVSEECTTTSEPLAISTGSLEGGTLPKDTRTVHSVKPSDDGIIKDSQPSLSKSDETTPTKKGLPATESFRHGSRAAKRKALEHIHKDVKGEDKTADRHTGDALPQPPKKKRGRPSKSPTKICKQKDPTTARSRELTERNTLIEIASSQHKLPLPKHDSPQTSRSVVRQKKLKKKKKTKYVNEKNLSDGIKATASSLNESVSDENISVSVKAVPSSLGESVAVENVSDHVKTPSSSLNEYLNDEKVSDRIKTASSSLNEYVNDENISDRTKTPSSSLNEHVNDENLSDRIKTSSSSLNEYVNDENASDDTKKPTSPLNENVGSIISTEKSDEPKDHHIDDKRCRDDPGHVTECMTKKFFTSHAGRSKFSPPYMLLSALINPSSKKNLSPPYSVKKKPQLTAKSSLDIYDFDEDDEETVNKTNAKSCKHPTTDKTVPSSKGKRGRKPKSHIKLNQAATEFPTEPVRDYVQITESYQPQCRFLRPRNRINYNENELDKPPPTETEEVGTNHHLPKTTFSVKKSSLSLKIKVPQPVVAVNNSISSDSEGHEEATDSLFRSAPECESKSPPKPHRKRHRDSSSGSHKMTVTSETISVTTNEVTHYGSDSDDPHQCSGPIIRAPNISEMNAHHRGKSALCEGCKDGECSMVVTTHRVRFRLVKIGQGLWKTIDAVQDSPVDGATADNRVHLQTRPERSPCLSDGNEDSSDDDDDDDDGSGGDDEEEEDVGGDDKTSWSSSNSDMPDLNDDGDFAQANDRDDRNDNSASSPPILHRTVAEPSPTLSNNISDAFSDAEDSGVSSQQKASPTASARPAADNSFSSSVSTSPRSHHSDTWDSVDTGLVSVCSQSGSNRKSDSFDSTSTSLRAPGRRGKKHLHQPSGELSPTCDSLASKQWGTSPKGSTRSHSDHLSSTINGGVECKNHRPTVQCSPVRSGHRRKSNSGDIKADRYPKRVRRTCHEPGSDSANNHNTVLAEDHDKSELELPPPDLDLFDDDCMTKTGFIRDNEAKAGIKSSPRLKYLPCVEDISDPESDGEKDVPGKFHNRDSDMPVLFSQRSRPQANKVKGDAEKDLDGNVDFAVPTPPPKYEPENVLEEAVQFDSEMSQSSCSTPSYPIVSPLTLGESCKVDKKDSDHKSVDAEEIDFAESFLNGAQTLSAEIEEQIRKQQQQQIQLEKQGQSAKRAQELLPSVDITPFAPDFQDMDYVYDLGLMSMTSTPNGTVYGSLNPAVINNKHVQNQDCSSSQAEFNAGKGKGSNRSDRKASDSKRRTTKSRSKKHSAGDRRVTSASPACVDNEMDKLLSQQSVGFELLDDFDETPFSSGGRAVSAQLDDLFEPSIMDNMNSSQGMDFTFTQSDGRGLIAAPSCDIGSDMLLRCVDIVEETKMIIHRQGGCNTPRHAGHGLDMHSLSGQGPSHDVSMGTSTMGIHTCDCGAQFGDQWSYQEHEVFCNGPQLFNCGL